MPVYPGAPHNTASGPDLAVSTPSTLPLGSEGTVMSEPGSAQADLGNLLWQSGDGGDCCFLREGGLD